MDFLLESGGWLYSHDLYATNFVIFFFFVFLMMMTLMGALSHSLKDY